MLCAPSSRDFFTQRVQEKLQEVAPLDSFCITRLCRFLRIWFYIHFGNRRHESKDIFLNMLDNWRELVVQCHYTIKNLSIRYPIKIRLPRFSYSAQVSPPQLLQRVSHWSSPFHQALSSMAKRSHRCQRRNNKLLKKNYKLSCSLHKDNSVDLNCILLF